MLLASKTIAESFKANITELSTIRTDWKEQYADELLTRVDDAINNHLGTDAKKSLRDATAALLTMQDQAKRDVAFFKTQIDDDFRKEPARRDEVLKTLGYVRNLKGVQKRNQEALTQLLYAFKTNMSEGLRQEITAKGLNDALIDRIVGYADAFKQANVAQESFKESTKGVTKEGNDTFNAIYDEIIGICKKASNYYQFEELKKRQFTFAKVLANLGAARKAVEAPTVPETSETHSIA